MSSLPDPLPILLPINTRRPAPRADQRVATVAARRLAACTAALLAGLASTGAGATFTVYTTEAAFRAVLASSGTDTFDDLDFTTTLATPQSRNAGSFAYVASVGPTNIFYPSSDDGVDVWLSPANRTDTMRLDGFGPAVRAAGGFFFGTDANGFSTSTPATLNLRATDSAGLTSDFALVDPTTGSFVGFVSTSALASLQVWAGVQGIGVNGFWPTANNLTLGSVSAVPETPPYALLAGGLALLGMAWRRQRG